jgi:hypothetical protein
MATKQSNAEDANNDGQGELDAALTEVLESDYTSADVTLTDAEYRRNITFRTTNLTVARDLNVPAIKRVVNVDNTDGTAALTVVRGSGSVVIAIGETAWISTDGTANDIRSVGGGGASFLGIEDNATAVRLTLGDSEVVFNESGADIDLRFEGDTNPNLFFLDAGNDRIGIGGVPTDGLLHLLSGSAGTVAASGNYDDIVVESSTHAGVTILTPNTASAAYYFGDPENSTAAGLLYDHNIQTMYFIREGAAQILMSPTAFTMNSGGEDINFIVEGDTNPNLIFVDAGLEYVGIGMIPVAAGGILQVNLGTEDLGIIDAGSASATEQDWIEVKVGGNTGYIRVFAAV